MSKEMVGLFTRVELSTTRSLRKDTSQKKLDSVAARHLTPKMALAALSAEHGGKTTSPVIYENASFLLIGQQPKLSDLDDGLPMSGKITSITFALDFAKIPYAMDTVIRTVCPLDKVKLYSDSFAQQVLDLVLQIKPRVVLCLCVEAARIFLPGLHDTVANVRGQAFPAFVGDHNFWVLVTHDPRYLEDGKYGPHPNALAVKFDTDLAIRYWKKNCLPDTTYMRKSKRELREFGSFIVKDVHKRVEALREFAKCAGKTIGLDYETSPKFPWLVKNPRITAIGLSDGSCSISIPFDHLLYLQAEDRENLIQAFKDVLSGRRVVAHNVIFELIWTTAIFGVETVQLVDKWECTQVGAYTIFVRALGKESKSGSEDSDDDADDKDRVPGTSLDDQCRLHFGISLKSLSPKDAWNEETTSIDDFLVYNCLDACFGRLLYDRQQQALEEVGLRKIYNFRKKRSIFLALSILQGMPVSQDDVASLCKKNSIKIKQIEDEFFANESIKLYEKRFGKFDPDKPDQVAKLLTKICDIDLGFTESGKYATDKLALNAAADQHPVAALIVRHREAYKQKSTYLDRLLPGHPQTYIGVDGKIHPRRNPTKLLTGRHSASDPNAHNYPARGPGKDIRGIVRPPSGWEILSIDLGQIEARVIAMASGDETFANSLRKGGSDIHKEWASRLEEYDSKWQENNGRDKLITLTNRHKFSEFKQLRNKTKNGFVFPAFFGAGARTISENMLMDESLIKTILMDDFWQTFKDVKKWHRWLVDFYKKNFYIESLLGFRIHGPLNYNNIINNGIQSMASDILQWAAGVITEHALDTNQLWQIPIIDIHDDLTWILPQSQVVSHLKQVVPIILHPPFDFINVPLTCEAKVGKPGIFKSWSDMYEIGVFSSDDEVMEIHYDAHG